MESHHSQQSTAANSGSVHSRALYSLFFTEMWERFSYYGMRALLVLFMVDTIKDGGMGLTDQTATAIYGLYTAGVYCAALPGGWLSDRFFGAQRSVWYGGIIIAAGHFVLALPGYQAFPIGLLLVVAGTGLLKPNVSAMVGELYPEGGARRDAGFSIFYMGINMGAFLGPLVCSALGEKVNWHYGFGAAGIGMVAGLIQFRLSRHHLGNVGIQPKAEPVTDRLRISLIAAGASLTVIIAGFIFGILPFNPVVLASGTSAFLAAIALAYFFYIFVFGGLEKQERQHVAVIVVLFISSALFWAGFEQTGSSFNLFAERHTAREWAGFVVPAGWFQSLGPIFVITLAPVMASLWIALARRHLNPSLPMKFAFGLMLLALGFVAMAAAAKLLVVQQRVSPIWLTTTYLLHTFGELCVSPVGLSSVTKLAPKRFVGQMMGIWFMATSLGNLVAGLLAGRLQGDGVEQMGLRYLQMAIFPFLVGGVLMCLIKPIKKWMGGIQ